MIEDATTPQAPAGAPAGAEHGVLAFRPLAPGDLPLLGTWLTEPHVARWWNHETSPEALERDFGPAMRGEEPAEDLLVTRDGEPVGLLQRCRWHDYPEYIVEMAGILTVPPGAVTIDYLVGRPADAGRGLGTRMIVAAVAEVWRRYPDAPSVLVPVVAANRASWRALERAGFGRAASGNLQPDNPVDPPLHHVYRIDRPVHP
ncbi:GNAT family N-acetyltransferase [Pseudonocardia nantongensis]|uniref:GNAT family N-acetyltransferase n=1 Tax=Pseudonocardia nantongensis TaxID=1181885 RepID=UPI00397C3C03